MDPIENVPNRPSEKQTQDKLAVFSQKCAVAAEHAHRGVVQKEDRDCKLSQSLACPFRNVYSRNAALIFSA